MNKDQNEKRPWVDVYISPVPVDDVKYPIFPKERETEIREISSETLRLEKYHAWRLLECALMQSLGLSLAEAGLYRHACGKWVSESVELSISHGGGAIAVAVSRHPVGIDLERRDRELSDGFARRMLTESENALLSDSTELRAVDIWCKKEALFKRGCESCFIPKATETAGEGISLYHPTVDGVEYSLAVAAEDGAQIRLIFPEGFA